MAAAATVCTAGVICGVYHAYNQYQEKKRNEYLNIPPEKWVQVGYVKRMYAYPVKSCSGVPLNHVELTPLGPRDSFIRDRLVNGLPLKSLLPLTCNCI